MRLPAWVAVVLFKAGCGSDWESFTTLGACEALGVAVVGEVPCSFESGNLRWVVLNNLGLTHYTLGHVEVARAFLGRATRLAPLEAVPAHNLLWLEVVENAADALEVTPFLNELGLRLEAALTAGALRHAGVDDEVWASTFVGVEWTLHGGASVTSDGVFAAPAWAVSEARPGDDPMWAEPGVGGVPLSVADLEFGRELCDFAGMATGERTGSTGEERYLDVVKRWVTGYLATDEQGRPFDVGYETVSSGGASNWDASDRAHVSSFAHVGSLNLLQTAARDVVARGVPGDVAECGVFRGGTAVLAAAAVDAFDPRGGRVVYAFDTFTGIPKLKAEDRATEDWPDDAYAAGDSHITNHFRQLGLDHRLAVVKGPFDETLRDAARPTTLALLRIDADTYEGTLAALTGLYDRLSPGGLVIVDDYHLGGCRRAVRDFRTARGITRAAPLLPAPIDYVLGCPNLDAKRAKTLAEDVAFGRANLRQNPMRLAQNVYWRKP